jgi:RNA polymerase subunit RPABC4/transcription elongation factor Spt4
MDKRLGLFLVAFVLLAAAVPYTAQAEPTRAMDADIIEIILDGSTADGGEYASGMHEISVKLNNTGDKEFMQWADFYINITYTSNESVYHYEMINKLVFISNNSMTTMDLIEVDLMEDQFKILVNATLGLGDTQAEIMVDIEDVVDLGIINVGFEEGMAYPLDEAIVPICNVSFEGNVAEFADTVNIALLIETDDVVSVTVYDEAMEILTPASPPVAPGKYWIVSFPAWTPSTSGPYEAVFTVYYDTYNEANNEDVISFDVADPPVIDGHVMAEGSPLPGVDVMVSTSPETTTTTDADGYYAFFDIPAGNYSIEFSKMWVSGNVTTVTVVPGETQVINVTLELSEVGGLRGYVNLPDFSPASGAWVIVSIPDAADLTATTNSTGYYEIEEVPAGNVNITASFSGYEEDIVETAIAMGTWNSVDLQLGDIPFNVSFSVPDGEPAFPVYDQISVIFTRPIERLSVDDSTLTLRKLSTGEVVAVEYSFADGDTTVVITPINPLEYATQYQIEVTSWIQDTNGDFFPAPVFSGFTTEYQIQELVLISFFPLDDANEVPIGVRVSAVFPQIMDADTINSTTFQLLGRGGVVVEAVVTYDAPTKTAYLDPVNDLSYGTRYSVSLDPDILADDIMYNFMGFTWSFETEVLVTTGSLVGKVLDEDGNPFSPTQVTIELSKGINNVLTKTPDPTGRFEFIDVEGGDWTLTITVTDYKIYTHAYSIVAGETTTIPADIELVKDADDETEDIPWPIIILIVIGVLLIIVIVYYLLNRPKEEAEEEEEHPRRPRFGREREEAYYGGYDEFAEGEFMCPVCGNVVEGEDTICPVCGSEFEDDLFECPECGASIPADALSCPECDAVFEEEESEEGEEDYYDEEEEVDITDDYEVEDLSADDFGIAEVE